MCDLSISAYLFLLEMDHENASGSCITNKRIPGLFGGVIVTILAKFY